MMYPVAILCGGMATRLAPMTDNVPKSLIEVAGRPFIDWQLDLLVSRGVTNVVLCTGYLGDMIRQHVGMTHGPIRVWYSDDGATRLGTAGALWNARKMLGAQFFVLYGDSYNDFDYVAMQAAFAATDALAMMAVCEPPPGYMPNSKYRDGQVLAYSKYASLPSMGHIDYGVGIYTQRSLSVVTGDLSDVQRALAHSGEMAGYLVDGRFWTMGTPRGLRGTEEYLSSVRVH